MECPICLEPVSEVEISVTPCGHPFCSECIMNVLGAATSTREASGDCPTCRDKITRSEIIFLGEAAEAGTAAPADAGAASGAASGEAGGGSSTSNINGCFDLTSTQTLASATAAGSAAPRASKAVAAAPRSQAQKQQQARADRALLPTLTSDFLSAFDKCEGSCGTKVARLLQEVEAMVAADPDSKCVAFSQCASLYVYQSMDIYIYMSVGHAIGLIKRCCPAFL